MNEYIKRVVILLSLIIGGFTLKGLITAISRVNTSSQDNYIVNIGYIGSYLSGVTSLIIVVLTALAVYYSYKGYKEEIKRVEQQKFEDHFFHLLEIHRENVKMMEIDKLNGGCISSNKVILWMFRELVLIIEIFQIKYKIDINNAKYDSKIGKIINCYIDKSLFKIH